MLQCNIVRTNREATDLGKRWMEAVGLTDDCGRGLLNQTLAFAKVTGGAYTIISRVDPER